MKKLVLACVWAAPFVVFSQPNCNLYKVDNNDACYRACVIATEETDGQGSRSSQMAFDRAIKLCPNLDYAYFEKSVPYLKRGDFISWRKMMDKAVELNPVMYLGRRGWDRYQFLRDYKGAIGDIEKLESLIKGDIGYSVNGDYHLTVAKALCYKAIGEKQKAIAIMEKQLTQKDYSPMLYDYLHLGVLKMEVGDVTGAIRCLEKSIVRNDYLAENYYYLGLIYKKQGIDKLFRENMGKAKAYYLAGRHRTDPYTDPMDRIYLEEIEKELTKVEN
jgi:predicted Zn-dependent protease